MKLKNTIFAILATASFVFAQNKPATLVPENAQPQFKAEDILALIPDNLAEYTMDGKTVQITSAKLKSKLKPRLEMMAAQGAPSPKDDIAPHMAEFAEQEALDQIIPLAIAKKGFKVDPAKVKETVDNIKEQLKMLKEQQLKNDENAYKNFLKSQGGVETEEAFLKQMEERISVEMPTRDFVESIKKELVVDDAEAKAEFAKNGQGKKFYTCSHILAMAGNPREGKKATEEEDAAALKKINEVLAKLKAGAKFEDLAKEYSDCPSKAQGGLLGEYDPEKKMPEGQMVPEFTKGFNALKPGEISPAPVKTEFGYHIIKASEIQEHKFEDLKDQIAEELKKQKFEVKMKQTIEQIKKDFQLKILAK